MRHALLALLILAAPLAAAYGALEPVNDLGTTARGVMDNETPLLPVPLRVAYSHNNTTWVAYLDANGDGRPDGDELGFPVPAPVAPPARVDGNVTDRTVVSQNGTALLVVDEPAGSVSAPGYYVHLCLADATSGLDGGARGLRCGGDVDGDGTPDTTEVEQGSNPIGPGPGVLP